MSWVFAVWLLMSGSRNCRPFSSKKSVRRFESRSSPCSHKCM